MSFHLGKKDLLNAQQMEVAVNGPDGATHLILCAGVVELTPSGCETYTFLVGPQVSRRQFVGVIVSGALSRIQTREKNSTGNIAELQLDAHLVAINANYDDESGRVEARIEVASSNVMVKLAVSYNVSILAELTAF